MNPSLDKNLKNQPEKFSLVKPFGRGGRRLESGAKAVTKTITMDPSDVDFFRDIGGGELSRGIRFAANKARELMTKEKITT